MRQPILAINAGSSSIKFQAFARQGDGTLQRLLSGRLDGIGTRPRLDIRAGDGSLLAGKDFSAAEVGSVDTAQGIIHDWLQGSAGLGTPPAAIGHRFVHGGPDFDAPVVIDDRVLSQLEALVPLAPLHQPNNIAPVRAWRARLPGVRQVACFDTAFHRGHGPLADRFAIPESLYREGVRRYGFHGLSYEFVADRLRSVAPDIAAGRIIVAHLGSGSSMCALRDGRSVDSTMSFTALDGIPMGTRPGALDPGVVLYLMREKGMDAAAIERLLYHESGLKGLSGISSDLRDLEASSDPQARLAIDHFVYRITREIGGLAAVLGGLDALVFTAGIGENSAALRRAIVEGSAWLGLTLDAGANASHRTDITAAADPAKSPTPRVLVVPTDEERLIAEHTWGLLAQP